MKKTMKIFKNITLAIIALATTLTMDYYSLYIQPEPVVALMQSSMSSTKAKVAIEEPVVISRSSVDAKETNISDIAPIESYAIEGATTISLEQYEIILKDTFLCELASVIKEVEDKYDINGIFIISVAQLESGHGTSNLAINKNNLFGLGSYGSDPYANAITFKSHASCIDFFGELIRNNYLNNNLISIEAIGKKYCGSSEWASKVKTLMKQNYEKL